MFYIERYIENIDLNSRMTAEQFLVLSSFYNYSKKSRHRITDMEIVFDEELILQYNACISDERTKQDFIRYISVLNEEKCKLFFAAFQKKPWVYAKPIIWSDRKKSKYYIDNLTGSHRFELYVERMFQERGVDIGLFYGKDEQYFSGESRLGIEIKNDKESLNTGNLYIEYQERLDIFGSWVDSGIFKKDNTIYLAIGTYENVFFLRKSKLKAIFEKAEAYEQYGIRLVAARRGTSKGFIVPIPFASRISETIEQVIDHVVFTL